ncbi:PRD domain-containing protein [Mitsuokella sp. WILCCON 0060]|uniref:PRD domain-containing protein n=1 Tax=unclassified Mitsuokella TaxID=2637239 RepID=UPI003EFCF710
MFRVIKPLNNNGLLALTGEGQEVILLGKGIGFGRKSGERLENIPAAKIYRLDNNDKRSALQAVNGIDPHALELAADVLEEARNVFPEMTDDILLPMADHIAMALERKRRGIRLPNPLQHDIMVMFPDEYRVAEKGLAAIRRESGEELPPEEAGYLSLHIHAGISEQKAGDSLTNIRLAAACIERIEKNLGCTLRRTELKYTRLISHICYMILRIRAQENVPLQMDEYVRKMYPKSYELAAEICAYLGEYLRLPVAPAEITLLAIHIQRVL